MHTCVHTRKSRACGRISRAFFASLNTQQDIRQSLLPAALLLDLPGGLVGTSVGLSEIVCCSRFLFLP